MQRILKDDEITNMDGTDHMRLQETFEEDYIGSNIISSDKKRNSIKVKEKRRSKKGPNIL